MPMRRDGSAVVRIVVGLRGTVAMRLELALRFGYGRIAPWIEPCDGGHVARCGPDQVILRGPVPVEKQDDHLVAAFSVAAGQRLAFVLSYAASHQDLPPPLDAEESLTATIGYWRDWIGRFSKPTHWPEATRRSLITLKALINRPTGGLVAAPTTSLPEKPEGALNWDYRYCWLRDATFTIAALLNAGYRDEAQHWRDWLLRAIAAAPKHMQIMYRLDGARHLQEWQADWLPGYRWARPVRIGNAAATQRQIDVFGELLDAFDLAHRAGIPPSDQIIGLEEEIVTELERVWREPGKGLWESRGEPHHYTYSVAMAWAGVDRFLRGAAVKAGQVPPDTIARLTALRSEIHSTVCLEGFHPGLGTFVQAFGGEEVDASLLMLPLIGFLPIDDPRITATITAIEQQLMDDGLVRREHPKGRPPQGAFIACSFWLADCRNMQGRADAAREVFERVLEIRNDLGLLSEEYNVRGRHLSGNFPQALSHLALVTSALGLSGAVLQRGGG